MIMGFVFFMFQGTFEELVCRSYLMPNLAKVTGDKVSIILTSVLFSALHLGNPNMGIISFTNLILFGVVFAVLYYRTGSLWICGISHGIWNFTMSFVYGAEVSGAKIGKAVLNSIPQAGKELISGGSFGYEASIITTIIGVLLVVIIYKCFKDVESV